MTNRLYVGMGHEAPCKRIGLIDARFDIMHPKFFPQLVEEYQEKYNEDAWTNNPEIVNAWDPDLVWVVGMGGCYPLSEWRYFNSLYDEHGMLPGEMWIGNWQQVEIEVPDEWKDKNDDPDGDTVVAGFSGGVSVGAVENP